MTFKKNEKLVGIAPVTVGFDLWSKIITMDEKRIRAWIYDTSGQDKFEDITNTYIRRGDGIVIVYDITDYQSFDSVKLWLDKVRSIRNDLYSVSI